MRATLRSYFFGRQKWIALNAALNALRMHLRFDCSHVATFWQHCGHIVSGATLSNYLFKSFKHQSGDFNRHTKWRQIDGDFFMSQTWFAWRRLRRRSNLYYLFFLTAGQDLLLGCPATESALLSFSEFHFRCCKTYKNGNTYWLCQQRYYRFLSLYTEIQPQVVTQYIT